MAVRVWSGEVSSLTRFALSMETCQLLRGYLDTLAARYPRTKFVSIVGDKVSTYCASLACVVSDGLPLFTRSAFQTTPIAICPPC